MDLENDERVKLLTDLIQIERDPLKLALLVQQLLGVLEEKKSEVEMLS